MIGGTDIVLTTRLTTDRALSTAARLVTRRWRAAVFQDGLTGVVFGPYAAVPFARVNELLVYRDAAAVGRWEAVGADASTNDTLIHLLAYEYGQLTVVLDDQPSAETRSMADSIAALVRYRSLPSPSFRRLRGAA